MSGLRDSVCCALNAGLLPTYPRRRRELALPAVRDEEELALVGPVLRLEFRRLLVADFFAGRPPLLGRFFEVVARFPPSVDRFLRVGWVVEAFPELKVKLGQVAKT